MDERRWLFAVVTLFSQSTKEVFNVNEAMTLSNTVTIMLHCQDLRIAI
jgi:hypothetical protein